LFWSGQFVSDLGGQLTLVALPCAVVLYLHASALQVGMLQAVEWGVIPLLAMIAGVFVDRRRRKPLMIGANVLRLCALATLPIAAALHVLTLAHVFVVAAITGMAAVLFDTAYQAFLPVLVGPAHVVEGNEKMAMGASTAEIAGSSLAGAMVQLAGAPLAFALNAAGYVFATLQLLRIRCAEQAPLRDAGAPGFRSELRDGLRVVLRSPVLRTIALANGTNHLGYAMVQAVFYVYLFRELHLAPVAIGLVLGFANAGVVAAGFAGRIARTLGVRVTLTGALVTSGAGMLALPLFGHLAPLVTLLVSRALLTAGGPVFDINQQTLRVQLVPSHLQGRMNATMRTLIWGALPAGSLLGGALGSSLGSVPAMIAGGAVALSGAFWMLLMPRLDDERRDAPVRALAA
jgi:predicted MFS family arabinose efflux permease